MGSEYHSLVRRSSFANHVRSKHPQFRHIVTKDYLDAIEGPRRHKSRTKRGRKAHNATLPLISGTSPSLGKVLPEPVGGCDQRAVSVRDAIVSPKTEIVNVPMGVLKVEETTAIDNKAEVERSRQVADGRFISVKCPAGY